MSASSSPPPVRDLIFGVVKVQVAIAAGFVAAGLAGLFPEVLPVAAFVVVMGYGMVMSSFVKWKYRFAFVDGRWVGWVSLPVWAASFATSVALFWVVRGIVG